MIFLLLFTFLNCVTLRGMNSDGFNAFIKYRVHFLLYQFGFSNTLHQMQSAKNCLHRTKNDMHSMQQLVIDNAQLVEMDQKEECALLNIQDQIKKNLIILHDMATKNERTLQQASLLAQNEQYSDFPLKRKNQIMCTLQKTETIRAQLGNQIKKMNIMKKDNEAELRRVRFERRNFGAAIQVLKKETEQEAFVLCLTIDDALNFFTLKGEYISAVMHYLCSLCYVNKASNQCIRPLINTFMKNCVPILAPCIRNLCAMYNNDPHLKKDVLQKEHALPLLTLKWMSHLLFNPDFNTGAATFTTQQYTTFSKIILENVAILKKSQFFPDVLLLSPKKYPELQPVIDGIHAKYAFNSSAKHIKNWEDIENFSRKLTIVSLGITLFDCVSLSLTQNNNGAQRAHLTFATLFFLGSGCTNALSIIKKEQYEDILYSKPTSETIDTFLTSYLQKTLKKRLTIKEADVPSQITL